MTAFNPPMWVMSPEGLTRPLAMSSSDSIMSCVLPPLVPTTCVAA